MIDFPAEDLTSRERAALIADLLRQGAKLSTVEIAQMTGLGERGARALVSGISRVCPILCLDGRWQLLTEGTVSDVQENDQEALSG
jgi:hypothetical protein